MTDVLPLFYQPDARQRNNSAVSLYRYESEFSGEACLPESESQLFPVLTPVYNGKSLNIPPPFVHASLSGISIKHYHGKCSEEVEEQKYETDKEEEFVPDEGEMEQFDWFQEEKREQKSVSEVSKSYDSSYREGQPLCTVPKINYRNSFWNIHRPEMCKLTWGQKYVSSAVVTEHLHGHLMQHGPLCEGFHTDKERQMLLDKELDEYVKLKVLASPRGIPPDEPFFPALDINRVKVDHTKHNTTPPIRVAFNPQQCAIPLADDDDIKGKNIHRLKEEFCLTIGKLKRGPTITKSITSLQESEFGQQKRHYGEEEGECFYYNWHLVEGEETFEGQLDVSSISQTPSYSDVDSMLGPCPPLMMDEFCKAAGKVDFSDLRCPDL